MKVDIQDVLFWMDAIRNSNDRYRTLESFWKGQINSKIWLIDELKKHITQSSNEIVIHGGWNGVLSSLLFNSEIPVKKITSIDVDPKCEEIAYTINKRQELEGRFQALTHDMCDHKYNADIVINTSCEHITDTQLKIWFDNIPNNSLIVMQSNNYYDLDEHINCVNSAEELAQKVNLTYCDKFEKEMPKYIRYMIIGKK